VDGDPRRRGADQALEADQAAGAQSGVGERTVARCDLDRALLHAEAPFRGRALHWLRNRLPNSIGQRRLFRNAPFTSRLAAWDDAGEAILDPGPKVVISRN
jgi:hypothetical protein